MSRAAESGSELTRLAEGLDLRVTIAMRAARPTLNAVAKRLKRKHGDDLLRAIGRALGSRRAVVIVDDLDRTAPASIPGILLSLREAMSLPGVHYLLALSPDIVKKGLVSAHPEWKDEPQDFLDKIVEYPFVLPPPSADDVLRAARILIEQDAKFPHPSATLDLGEYLPKNPRRLKLFLRLVGSLAPQLDRYSANEIDLQRALLAQMLRVEFPSESVSLIQDKEAVKSIESDFAMRMLRERRRGQEEAPNPEEAFAPKEPAARRQRFMALCGGLRERDAFRSELGLVDLFHLVDRPGVMTLKELDGCLRSYQEGASDAWRAKLDDFLSSPDAEDEARRADAVWRRLVGGRERIWGTAVDIDAQEGIAEWVDLLPAIDAMIRHVGVERDLFGKRLLGAEHWIELWKRVADWDRFTHLPAYPPIRDTERALVQDISDTLPAETRAKVWFQLGQRDMRHEGSQALQELRTSLMESFEDAAVSLALERFVLPDGVDLFWGRNEYGPEKHVAFNPDSKFHAEAGRQRLVETADRAAEETTVQLNFLTYLRMLLYGAQGGAHSFNTDQCRTLLMDTRLIEPVWAAAVAAPLNPRVVGSVRKQIAEAHEAGIQLPDLEKPHWWKKIEETVFDEDDGELGSQE